MQKKLADYFRLLLERRDDFLLEFYEPGSLMLSDEAIVIMGLLVGLNVIDCNLCVKVYFFIIGSLWSTSFNDLVTQKLLI